MMTTGSRERVRWSRSEIWTLTVSCASVSLVVAAMAALYGALPSLALDTGASQQQLTWIVDGYSLALACLVLPAGAMGDRFGRRRLQVAGLWIFAIASSIPLVATAPATIIATRVLAGVGAALVMPSTLSLMTASFPPSQRSRAIAIWAGVVGAGGMTGLLGAGLLLEAWSWQSIFWGLAVAGVVLGILAMTVREPAGRSRPRLDPAGSLLIGLAICAVVYSLMEGPDRGWTSITVVASFVVGAAALALFVPVELRRDEPLLDLSYFRRRAFGSATFCITLQFLVTFGLFLLLVQWFQLVLGYNALTSALALAPLGPPVIVLSVLSPWIARRVGHRVMYVAGLTAIGAGLLFFTRLGPGSSFASVVGPMLLISCGMGLCTTPATTTIVRETPAEKHGVAAAVNDAARELGSALGIAIAGSALAAIYTQRIHPVLHYLPEAARGPVSKSLAGALQVAERAGPRAKPLAEVAKSAFLHGVDRAALVLAITCLAGALIVTFWAPRRAAEQPGQGGAADREQPASDDAGGAATRDPAEPRFPTPLRS